MGAAPLFWRVFTLNALVFLAGVGGLALSPATVSWPLQPTEMLDLVIGLVVMLAMNGLLLRVGLAPLDRLIAAMDTVDLLRPGQRLPERGSGRLNRLVRTFNQMLERLEAERASSSAHALSAQEAERSRIARELHDEVGQGLTVVLLEVSRLADQVEPSLRPTLEHVLESTRDSLADVRRIAQRLRPDALEELGLAAALTALANEFSEFSGLPVRRRLAPPTQMSQDVELAIYRIAQESLTNVARHARARHVELSLDVTNGDKVALRVKDDGCGRQGGEGAGIRGMRERALLVHGHLDVTSTPGTGTRVQLVTPVGRSSEAELPRGANAHPAG